MDPDYIHDCLLEHKDFKFRGNSKIVFLSANALAQDYVRTKKGNSWEITQLTFHLNTNVLKIELDRDKAHWLMKMMEENSVTNLKKTTLQHLKISFEEKWDDFELFWFSKPMQQLKENGVVLSL